MDTQNVGGLSAEKQALLEQRLRSAAGPAATEPVLARPTHRGPAPLSPAQEQLWYFVRLVPDNPVFNEIASVHHHGPLDVQALAASWNEVVRRHEILRSTFELRDGEPVQIVGLPPTFELPVIDVSATPAHERERAAGRIVAETAGSPYDLKHGPMVRSWLVRFSDDEHRLYLGLHHLVVDGVSITRVIVPEIAALYETFAAGQPPALPAPTIQYADYAATRREVADRGDDDRHVDYWREHLAGATPLQLPLDHPRAPQQRFRGAMKDVRVGGDLYERLRSLARTSESTLFQLVSASFAVLLHRFSGQDDIVFGTLSDMRRRGEFERMVGYCVTPLVLRADMSDDPSFLEVLSRGRGELLAALAHQMPFERLVRALAPRRQPGANPLFQVGCVLQPRPRVGTPGWSLRLAETAVGNVVGNTKFDLLLELQELDGRIDGRWTYDRDLFSAATIDRFAECWMTLLEGIVADPTLRASELPLLDEVQRRRQLAESNATAATYQRDTCLHELVAAQAARTPDAIAAVFGSEQLTYRELDGRADAVARRLSQCGTTHGPVAIYLERSLEMLVGMLGILKSGAAYLPLDLSHPVSRLSFMMRDSGATRLLTDRELLTRLPDPPDGVVCIDEAAADAGAMSQLDGPSSHPSSGPSVTADDLAYVLYTSGSTGRPKAVCISHRSVVNLLTSVAREPGMSADDTIVAITTYAFDIAAIELWLPLVTGARLVMLSREHAADARRLATLVDEREITIMQATPATWQMLIDAGWRGRSGLKAISTGETLPPQLAEALLQRVPELWNMYGPTETTVWSTGEQVRDAAPITIGRPIANTRIYILGRGHQRVPTGVAGELVIAGDGVGVGYLNRPELTSERFVADPFVPGERMYLTGDLARERPDGRIEHLGRLDHQIKIRGFRVEPGEIQEALTAAPDISAAVVLATGQELADTRLIAYVVPDGPPPPPSELRDRLRATLPEYMVPSAFVVLDALPVSANGKIDRAALPEPRADHDAGARPSQAPRDDAERRMATLWEAILGVAPVGVEDDFFELGGHSMLALRLLVEVEREFGIEVPLSWFFDGAGVTVAGLAATVAASRRNATGAASQSDPAAEGSLCLFFVHPHESSMLTLRHFKRPLGSDYRLVGLLPDRIAGRFDASQSVEGLVAPMLDVVRRNQAHGPYYIAGYSLGGLLAYELAGRLRAAGEPVAWLGVLDTAAPAADARWLAHMFSLRQRLARQWQRGPRGALLKVDELVRRQLTDRLVRLNLRRPEVSEEFDGLGAAKLSVRYACPPHDVPMDLFVTDVRVAGAGSDSLGWEAAHGGRLRVHRVEGDHTAIVTDGYVDAVADLVSAGIKEARDDAP